MRRCRHAGIFQGEGFLEMPDAPYAVSSRAMEPPGSVSSDPLTPPATVRSGGGTQVPPGAIPVGWRRSKLRIGCWLGGRLRRGAD
jgi:hypothetical protein